MIDSYVTDEFDAIRKTPSEHFEVGESYKIKTRLWHDTIQVRARVIENLQKARVIMHYDGLTGPHLTEREIGIRYESITEFLDDWSLKGFEADSGQFRTKDGMLEAKGYGWTAEEASNMIIRSSFFGSGREHIDDEEQDDDWWMDF